MPSAMRFVAPPFIIHWEKPAVKIRALLAIFLLGSACSLGESAEVNPPKGFVAIFNGKDLTGWWGLSTENPAKWMALSEEEFAKKKAASIENIREHWTVEDGELVNDGHGLYLSTEKNYGDFELLIDYKTVPKADSGIYLRGVPQVQIWDPTEEAKFKLGADKGSGGLWNNSAGAAGKDPLVLADKPFGEWNHFRIVMVGEYVTVYLNDKLVVDHARLENYFDRSGPLPKEGPIQLQTHGGEIRWRNVYLREIPAEEANQILRQGGLKKRDSQSQFKSLFNGQDFEGWAGPIDNYQVSDGAIMCKPGKGGTIYTKEEYSDFVVQLEFQLPPGGNNGLAIRYPGSGDTAYVGMCELQVLDDGDARYAKLDPRQAHGSAYGMVAAHRGFLRPVGEWNYQEVTVRGSTIRVVLNGFRILDADLAQVTEYMGGRPHPGKDRISGHFGFAGHSSPVQFRNIAIQRLED